MSATHNAACTDGIVANFTAPNAAGTMEPARSVAPIPTSRANTSDIAGVFLSDTVAKTIPQITIQATWATIPAVVGRNRGAAATPAPCITCSPSVAKGPDQSL